MVRKADSNRWTPGRCLLSPQFDMPPANMCVFPRGARLVEVVAIMNQAALTADLCMQKIIKDVSAQAAPRFTPSPYIVRPIPCQPPADKPSDEGSST